MKIWFSSDWHLSHTNITGPIVSKWKSGYRDFDHVHDMNKCIINTINTYVAPDDIIYFLGDFCFGGHEKTPNLRWQINCQTIHLCKGNHDQHIEKYKDVFTSTQDVLCVSHGKHKFFLSHYAHRIWPGSHKGVIHLYGHSHNSIPDFGKSMDVGVDVARKLYGEYRPFSIEEIISIMGKKETKEVDHYNIHTNT